jgi:hypothetical protein
MFFPDRLRDLAYVLDTHKIVRKYLADKKNGHNRLQSLIHLVTVEGPKPVKISKNRKNSKEVIRFNGYMHYVEDLKLLRVEYVNTVFQKSNIDQVRKLFKVYDGYSGKPRYITTYAQFKAAIEVPVPFKPELLEVYVYDTKNDLYFMFIPYHLDNDFGIDAINMSPQDCMKMAICAVKDLLCKGTPTTLEKDTPWVQPGPEWIVRRIYYTLYFNYLDLP